MNKDKLDWDLRVRISWAHAEKVLKANYGELLHLVPYQNQRPARPSANSHKSPEARDIIIATLKQMGNVVPRKKLSDTLKKRGFSEASTGPICNLLERDGVIVSPKRGYWQIKRKRA